jgi:hypothetical protein
MPSRFGFINVIENVKKSLKGITSHSILIRQKIVPQRERNTLRMT